MPRGRKPNPNNPNAGNLVFRPTGTMIFYYRFRLYRGLEFSGSTHTPNKKEAEAFARKERERLVHMGEDAARPYAKGGTARRRPAAAAVTAVTSGPVGKTFGAAVIQYYEQQCTKQTSEQAIHADLENLMRLVDSIGADVPLASIDEDIIKDQMAERRKEFRYGVEKNGRLSESTIYETVPGLLKRVFRYHAKHAPVIEWRQFPRVHNIRTREVSHEEEAALDPLQSPGYRDCFDFGILSGLRRENLTGMKWRQVNLPERTMKVVVKGKKPETVFLTDPMMAILTEQRGHDKVQVWTYVARRTGPVPRTTRSIQKGKRYPMTSGGFYEYIRSLQKKLGTTDDPFTIHDLRRTAACRTVRVSGIYVASKQLHHSSVKTTETAYAFLGDEALRDALEATHQRSREIREKIAVENSGLREKEFART